jgi:hypothetical protein
MSLYWNQMTTWAAPSPSTPARSTSCWALRCVPQFGKYRAHTQAHCNFRHSAASSIFLASLATFSNQTRHQRANSICCWGRAHGMSSHLSHSSFHCLQWPVQFVLCFASLHFTFDRILTTPLQRIRCFCWSVLCSAHTVGVLPVLSGTRHGVSLHSPHLTSLPRLLEKSVRYVHNSCS